MKKLLLLMLCLVMAMSMLLTSCKKDKGNDDDDEGSGEQGGGNEGGEQGGNTECTQHVGTLVCENCLAPLYTMTLPKMPEITSFGMKVTEVQVTVDQDDYITSNGTVTANLAELYVALTEEGTLTGYGHGSLTYTYASPVHSNTVAANAYIEDNKVYVYVDGTIFGDVDETITAAYCVDVANIAQLKDAEEQLNSYLPMIEQYAPIVIDWLENDLAPLFSKIDLSGLDAAEAVATKNVAKLINGFFTATTNNGVTTLTFNFDAVKTWNQALKDNTIDKIIDMLCGAGTFAKLEALAQDDKLYNYSVAQLLDYLKTKQGIDPFVLLDTVDLLVVDIMGEGATLESMLGFDPATYLENEDILAMSVKDALAMIMPSDPEAEAPITPDEAVAQAKAMAAQVFGMAKTTTVYDVIASSMGGNRGECDPDDPNPDFEGGKFEEIEDVLPTSAELEEEVDQMQMIVDRINSMLDMAASFFNFTITASNGAVTSINFDAAFDAGEALEVNLVVTPTAINFSIATPETEAEGGSMTVVATSEKVVVTYCVNVDDVVADASFEIVPNMTLTPDAEKLAAAKALLAKADGKVTTAMLYSAIKEYYEDRFSGYAVLIDGDDIYLIEIDRFYQTGYDGEMFNYYVDYEVTLYNANDYFALGVRKGCGNDVLISPVFNVKEGSGSFPVKFNTTEVGYKDILNLVTVDKLTADLDPDKHLQGDTRSEEIVIDANGNLVADHYGDWLKRYGHDYVEDTTRSNVGEACNVVYWRTYECRKCHDVYVDYDSNNHNFYDDTYTKIGDNEFKATAKCGRDNGCTATSDIGKFTVDAADDLSYFGTALGTSKGAVYKVVADADISYILSATGDARSYFNVTVYYAENGTTNYKHYTGDSFSGSYDNYSGYKAEVNLGEGYDYYIIIRANEIQGTCSNITIEKN